MKMSQLETLTLWDQGVSLWDQENFGEAFYNFSRINSPSSRILFNIGCIHLRRDNLQEALSNFNSTIEKDQHLAVAYFQRATVYYLLKRFSDALKDFEESQRLLRERSHIDYGQLGLRYKLYSCECLHNAGVVQAQLGRRQEASRLLQKGMGSKVEARHASIDDSLRTFEAGSVPSLINLPPDAIFRPSKSKVANMEKKNYLGKAQVVSSVQDDDKFAGFVGPKMRDAGLLPKSNPSSPVPGRRQKTVISAGHKSADNSPEAMRKPAPPPRENRSPSLPILSFKDQFPLKGKSLPPAPNKPPPVIYELEKMLYIDKDGEEPWLVVSKVRPPPPTRMPPGLDIALKPPAALPIGVPTPPPTRPPPKLRNKPLPRPDTRPNYSEQKSASKSTIAVTPLRKPANVPNSPPLAPRKKSRVKLELHCNSTIVTEVEHGACLSVMVNLAAKQFRMKETDFDLWYNQATDDEWSRITNEKEMKSMWDTVISGQLTLWCFGKK